MSPANPGGDLCPVSFLGAVAQNWQQAPMFGQSYQEGRGKIKHLGKYFSRKECPKRVGFLSPPTLSPPGDDSLGHWRSAAHPVDGIYLALATL